jgi:hypothetical protein
VKDVVFYGGITKLICTWYGKNAELLHVKAGGICNYHCVLNVKGVGCDGVDWA